MTDIRLIIAVPTAGTCRMGFCYSVAGLVAGVAARGIPSRPEASIDIKMDVVESSNWITNREQLVRRAVDNGMTHLLFLDDDMTFEPDVLNVMLGRRQPVVVTNYLIKTEECDSFVAVGLNGQRVPTLAKSTGMEPIAYSGFGVSLFDLDVFRKIPQPWFLPEFIADSSSYTTEDNPCYAKIRDAGYPVYLDHDASKMVAHVGNAAWIWKDYKHG